MKIEIMVITGYICFINLLAFLLMGMDKRKARKHKRRIPEKWLFAVAAWGGSLGGSIGMRVWHHKTKHRAFVYGFPALLLLHVLILIGYFLYERSFQS